MYPFGQSPFLNEVFKFFPSFSVPRDDIMYVFQIQAKQCSHHDFVIFSRNKFSDGQDEKIPFGKSELPSQVSGIGSIDEFRGIHADSVHLINFPCVKGFCGLVVLPIDRNEHVGIFR